MFIIHSKLHHTFYTTIFYTVIVLEEEHFFINFFPLWVTLIYVTLPFYISKKFSFYINRWCFRPFSPEQNRDQTPFTESDPCLYDPYFIIWSTPFMIWSTPSSSRAASPTDGPARNRTPCHIWRERSVRRGLRWSSLYPKPPGQRASPGKRSQLGYRRY